MEWSVTTVAVCMFNDELSSPAGTRRFSPHLYVNTSVEIYSLSSSMDYGNCFYPRENRKNNHLVYPSAEVKNIRSFTSTPPTRLIDEILSIMDKVLVR
jgi:hypothetical protein